MAMGKYVFEGLTLNIADLGHLSQATLNKLFRFASDIAKDVPSKEVIGRRVDALLAGITGSKPDVMGVLDTIRAYGRKKFGWEVTGPQYETIDMSVAEIKGKTEVAKEATKKVAKKATKKTVPGAVTKVLKNKVERKAFLKKRWQKIQAQKAGPTMYDKVHEKKIIAQSKKFDKMTPAQLDATADAAAVELEAATKAKARKAPAATVANKIVKKTKKAKKSKGLRMFSPEQAKKRKVLNKAFRRREERKVLNKKLEAATTVAKKKATRLKKVGKGNIRRRGLKSGVKATSKVGAVAKSLRTPATLKKVGKGNIGVASRIKVRTPKIRRRGLKATGWKAILQKMKGVKGGTAGKAIGGTTVAWLLAEAIQMAMESRKRKNREFELAEESQRIRSDAVSPESQYLQMLLPMLMQQQGGGGDPMAAMMGMGAGGGNALATGESAIGG